MRGCSSEGVEDAGGNGILGYGHGEGECGGEGDEVEQVACIRDGRGSRFEECVHAGMECAGDRSGDREYLSAKIERKLCRDERAGIHRRFDDHGACGESGNDAVARGEVHGDARRAGNVFAHDGTVVLEYGLGEATMRGWRNVASVGSGAEYRDGTSVLLYTNAMRDCIDAVGESGDDRAPRAGQRFDEVGGCGNAVGRCGTRADHREERRCEQRIGVAAYEECDGWIGDGCECRGIPCVPMGDDRDRCVVNGRSERVAINGVVGGGPFLDDGRGTT